MRDYLKSNRKQRNFEGNHANITCPYFVMKLLARFKDVIAGSSLAFSALARANAPLSCSNEEEKQIMAFVSIGS